MSSLSRFRLLNLPPDLLEYIQDYLNDPDNDETFYRGLRLTRSDGLLCSGEGLEWATFIDPALDVRGAQGWTVPVRDRYHDFENMAVSREQNLLLTMSYKDISQ